MRTKKKWLAAILGCALAGCAVAASSELTNGVFTVKESKTLHAQYKGDVLIESDAINYLDSLEGADDLVTGEKGKTSVLNVIQKRPGPVQFRKEVALHEDGRMELTVRMRFFPYMNQPNKPSVSYSFMVPAKLLDGMHFKALTGRVYAPKVVEGAFSADRKDGSLLGVGCRFIAFKSDKMQLVIDCNPHGLISESDYCCYGTPVGIWNVVKKGESVVFSFGYPAVTYGGVFAGKVIFYTGEYDYPAKHFYQTWGYNGPTPALAQFTFGDREQTKGFEKADCAAYDAKKGWGWENPAGLEALTTESPDIVANCVSAADGKERTFRLDVTPGRYMVTIRAGHNTKEIGPFDIQLNGTPCARGAAVEAGQTKTFVLPGQVRAADGALRVSFAGQAAWAVRSIVVQPIIYRNEDFAFDRGLWMADGLFSPEIE